MTVQPSGGACRQTKIVVVCDGCGLKQRNTHLSFAPTDDDFACSCRRCPSLVCRGRKR